MPILLVSFPNATSWENSRETLEAQGAKIVHLDPSRENLGEAMPVAIEELNSEEIIENYGAVEGARFGAIMGFLVCTIALTLYFVGAVTVAQAASFTLLTTTVAILGGVLLGALHDRSLQDDFKALA